jgi:hypothetical protein
VLDFAKSPFSARNTPESQDTFTPRHDLRPLASVVYTTHTYPGMSIQQYTALLAPPNLEDAGAKALVKVNAAYKTWDQYETLAESDSALEAAQARAEDLNSKVRLKCKIAFSV